MAPLDEYRRRRDPAATPEPFGGSPAGGAPVFVVHRHRARRLHYDLRLERDGALASWAVPHGLPLERGARHLAVHVEDHPLGYATFEGEIPAGQYGAGTVEIWDAGTYELLEEKRDGGLTVHLRGRRVDGVWTLVPARLDGDERNWLLLRKDGEPASRRAWKPMLAASAATLPSGAGWLYEVKWDGFRVVARLEGGVARLVSRTGQDLTGRFATVARALPASLATADCVVDGEVVALRDDGRPSFQLLQAGGGTLQYELFDLLEADGVPLDGLPLEERRARLAALVRPSPAVRVPEVFTDGAALLEVALREGLEGVVAKRAGSRYQAGRRSGDWVKVKARSRQELVICGWTRGSGARASSLGALVLAVHHGARLRWAGNVGSGFTEAELRRLLALLGPLRRDEPALSPVPRALARDVTWVEPRLVCEVEFAEWTHDGRLRAPVYLGLREDRPPAEVVREEPLPAEIRRGGRVVRLSNLDKPFWPEEGITKGDLLSYYREVAPAVVPHLRGRPFTLKRYPDGWQGKHFFQKDAPKGMPEWIHTVELDVTARERPRETRRIRAPLVDDAETLLWMVNAGCVDLNAWSSRVDHPDRPDWVLFDLDPADDAGFAEAVEVALLVRAALDALGLRGYPKTSGGDGIHVLVPIARRHTYADARHLAEVVAGALAASYPGLVTTEWTRVKRRGVLIDANQNGRGRTTATVYSVRPRAGAPVSTPLRWDELAPSLDPAAFTMEEVLARLGAHGDLFAPVLEDRQSLSAALRSLG